MFKGSVKNEDADTMTMMTLTVTSAM